VVLGQGYLWMTHKTPGSPTWDLSMRSHQLWTMLADNLQEQGLDPMVELGWKKTGIVAAALSFYNFSLYTSCNFGWIQTNVSQKLKLH
jgi:hypothetical protein